MDQETIAFLKKMMDQIDTALAVNSVNPKDDVLRFMKKEIIDYTGKKTLGVAR